ncbi:MAG: hypothetical protein L0Z54_02775 [Thermoplasmata archaeon]|nr:hypothetical protein [Thermoplasmata archaeon]
MPAAFCKHGTVWTRCTLCRQEYLDSEKRRALGGARFKTDRNMAFKCNWMDTDYVGPCGPRGRRWNIHEARHAWCSLPDNECNLLELGKATSVSEFPCYECRLFTEHEITTGVISGKRPGKGLRFDTELIGKLALLTTRGPKDEEEDRSVFGFLRIDGSHPHPEYGSTILTGDPETSIKIPARARLRFWDFYANPRNPTKLWGYGLFRYVPDSTVEAYLEAQLEKLNPRRHQHEHEVVHELLEIWRRNTRLM